MEQRTDLPVVSPETPVSAVSVASDSEKEKKKDAEKKRDGAVASADFGGAAGLATSPSAQATNFEIRPAVDFGYSPEALAELAAEGYSPLEVDFKRRAPAPAPLPGGDPFQSSEKTDFGPVITDPKVLEKELATFDNLNRLGFIFPHASSYSSAMAEIRKKIGKDPTILFFRPTTSKRANHIDLMRHDATTFTYVIPIEGDFEFISNYFQRIVKEKFKGTKSKVFWAARNLEVVLVYDPPAQKEDLEDEKKAEKKGAARGKEAAPKPHTAQTLDEQEYDPAMFEAAHARAAASGASLESIFLGDHSPATPENLRKLQCVLRAEFNHNAVIGKVREFYGLNSPGSHLVFLMEADKDLHSKYWWELCGVIRIDGKPDIITTCFVPAFTGPADKQALEELSSIVTDSSDAPLALEKVQCYPMQGTIGEYKNALIKIALTSDLAAGAKINFDMARFIDSGTLGEALSDEVPEKITIPRSSLSGVAAGRAAVAAPPRPEPVGDFVPEWMFDDPEALQQYLSGMALEDVKQNPKAESGKAERKHSESGSASVSVSVSPLPPAALRIASAASPLPSPVLARPAALPVFTLAPSPLAGLGMSYRAPVSILSEADRASLPALHSASGPALLSGSAAAMSSAVSVSVVAADAVPTPAPVSPPSPTKSNGGKTF